MQLCIDVVFCRRMWYNFLLHTDKIVLSGDNADGYDHVVKDDDDDITRWKIFIWSRQDLISAEEIAIATKATEPKVIQYVSMVKWASENIKDKWSALHESLIAAKTGRCFAKG